MYDFITMAKPTSFHPKPSGTVSPQDVPITNPDDLAAVYSNHFGASATMSDITVYFLQIGQIPGPKGHIHKQEVKAMVTIPITMAPALIQVLEQTLQAHGEKFKDFMKQMSSGQ